MSHVNQLQLMGESIDYLAFVPDGEPTLDAHLDNTIELLRPLGIPIAIITNASLIWREDIRETLMKADWVSLKVDAIDDALWRRINQPHSSLDHQAILQGMKLFAQGFKGTLVSETMLVSGVNDNSDAATKLADYLHQLAPSKAYLSVPIPPPAEKHVRIP